MSEIAFHHRMTIFLCGPENFNASDAKRYFFSVLPPEGMLRQAIVCMSKIIILWIAGLCCLNVSAETDDVYARAQEIAIILENIDTSPLENKLQADRPVWPSDLNPRANEKLEIRSLRELEEYIHTLPSARQFRLMDLSIQQAEWLLQNLREGLGKAKGERQTAEVYVFPTAGALVSLGLLVFFKGPKSELLSRLFCLSGLAIGSGSFCYARRKRQCLEKPSSSNSRGREFFERAATASGPSQKNVSRNGRLSMRFLFSLQFFLFAVIFNSTWLMAQEMQLRGKEIAEIVYGSDVRALEAMKVGAELSPEDIRSIATVVLSAKKFRSRADQERGISFENLDDMDAYIQSLPPDQQAPLYQSLDFKTRTAH